MTDGVSPDLKESHLMETTMDKTQTQTAIPTEPKKLMSFREFLKSNYVPTKPKGPKKK